MTLTFKLICSRKENIINFFCMKYPPNQTLCEYILSIAKVFFPDKYTLHILFSNNPAFLGWLNGLFGGSYFAW